MKTLQVGRRLLLAVLLIPGAAKAQLNEHYKNETQKEVDMNTAQTNKEVVRKIYEESLNKRNLGSLKEIISEDYTGVQGMKGVAGFEPPITQLIQAFPDVQWKVLELIAEGDKVMVKWEIQGTHTHTFQHIAPTGKKISGTGMGVYTLRDGKVVSTQVQTDRLGFLQELGVLPVDLSQLTTKKTHTGQVTFIDKFFVPVAARQEFYERMGINRSFIKQLPGFIRDDAYECTDDKGNLVCVTLAQWESREAFNKAREAVQAEYAKQGFDIGAMLKRLNITLDRGVYTEVKE
jgi:predicted ester cyclase/heme-degrading monooxygenase HmoA